MTAPIGAERTRDRKLLVIFDCDGVLIDSERLACDVQARELAKGGYAITGDEVAYRYVGMSAADMRRAIEAELGRSLPPDHEARAAEALKEAFRGRLEVVSGMAELIDGVAEAGYLSCVASSSSLERVEFALALVGLWDRFAPRVFSSSMVARGKPAPDLFLFAADAMTVEAGNCIVVEDSVPGIRAARAAGMGAIGFCAGSHCGAGHASRLLEAGAHHVCNDATTLLGLLQAGAAHPPAA